MEKAGSATSCHGFFFCSHIEQVLYNVVTATAHPSQKPALCLSLVPQTSLAEFWLPLHSFDYSRHSKHGCGGWKQMHVTKHAMSAWVFCLKVEGCWVRTCTRILRPSTLQFTQSMPSSRSTSKNFWLATDLVLKVWMPSSTGLQPAGQLERSPLASWMDFWKCCWWWELHVLLTS